MKISFFPSKFLEGTKSFTNDQAGIYIRALCLQAESGFLTKEKLIELCGEDKAILSKFKVDEHGNFYNKRMRKEMIEAMRMEARDKEIKRGLHLFVDSELYDEHIFKSCFPSWSKPKLRHYYDRAEIWSLNKDGMSKDWAKTVRDWASQDERNGMEFKENNKQSHSSLSAN